MQSINVWLLSCHVYFLPLCCESWPMDVLLCIFSPFDNNNKGVPDKELFTYWLSWNSWRGPSVIIRSSNMFENSLPVKDVAKSFYKLLNTLFLHWLPLSAIFFSYSSPLYIMNIYQWHVHMLPKLSFVNNCFQLCSTGPSSQLRLLCLVWKALLMLAPSMLLQHVTLHNLDMILQFLCCFDTLSWCLHFNVSTFHGFIASWTSLHFTFSSKHHQGSSHFLYMFAIKDL